MTSGVLPMALAGLATSGLAPALLLITGRGRSGWDWDRLALPAVLTLPLFAVLHAATMILMAGQDLPAPVELPLHALLLLGAIVFWLPVLGTRRRLPDPGRTVYLFLAAPTLDLAGVWIIARGDTAGGLAMIVAMLPIGLAAIGVTWRWIVREERLRRQAETDVSPDRLGVVPERGGAPTRVSAAEAREAVVGVRQHRGRPERP